MGFITLSGQVIWNCALELQSSSGEKNITLQEHLRSLKNHSVLWPLGGDIPTLVVVAVEESVDWSQKKSLKLCIYLHVMQGNRLGKSASNNRISSNPYFWRNNVKLSGSLRVTSIPFASLLLVSQVRWPVMRWNRNSKSFCWASLPRTWLAMVSIILWFTTKNSGTRKCVFSPLAKAHDTNTRTQITCMKTIFLFLLPSSGPLTTCRWTKALLRRVARPLPASTPCRHQSRTRTTSPWGRRVRSFAYTHGEST